MFKKILSLIVIVSFFLTSLGPLPNVYAQNILSNDLNLPSPGSTVALSAKFSPAIMRGITIHPENPLKFDFIINTGDDDLQGEAFNREAMKLIKYFLVSLTVPDKELWVNLSPYEKNRIIPESFGVTGMGKDLLEQDYLLKQLTASLIRPVDDLGRKFWDRVYAKAYKLYGTTNVPVDTFNKVWIVPDKAVVYEHNGSAFVAEKHLKVMLEEDYLALKEHHEITPAAQDGLHTVGANIVRELIVPEIEKEVNEGKNFATVRQVFNSMILATWYKKTLRESLLGQVYVNQNKIKGIDIKDKQAKEKIYEQYLIAFKKGVYSSIREEYDPYQHQSIPRKYFSGGIVVGVITEKELQVRSGPMDPVLARSIAGQGSQIGRDHSMTTVLVENAGADILTRMVARAPSAERHSWEARRRDHPNVEPNAVATFTYDQFFNLLDTDLPEDLTEVQATDIKLTAELHRQGRAFLSKYLGADVPRPETAKVEVVIAEDYDGLLGLENGKIFADQTFVRRMGLNNAKEVEQNTGMIFLSAINQLYVLSRLDGKNAQQALEKVLEFYEKVKAERPQSADLLHEVLRGNIIDSDNLFSFFLNKATGPIQASRAGNDAGKRQGFINQSRGWFDTLFQSITQQSFSETDKDYPDSLPRSEQSEQEITAQSQKEWKERWIAWFIGQRDFDSPVDLERMDEILNSPDSKDVQIQQLLDLEKKYDSKNEKRNARRKLYQLLEHNQTLSVSRFGRASYFLMLLAAGSRFVSGIQKVEEAIHQLAGEWQVPTTRDASYRDLEQEIKSQTLRIQKYLEDIRVMIQPGRNPSHAELKGRIEKLEEMIRQYQTISLSKIAEFGNRTGHREYLHEIRDNIFEVTKQMLNVTDTLLLDIDAMPGDRINFSVLIQRASKTGVLPLDLARLGYDPFGGGEPLIAEAYRQGGDMTYASRDDIWFENAQYWVEALPLMIHEEKVTLDNGEEITKLVIEQEAMELALRGLAPKFKNNIDNVIDSEHVALARLFIVQHDPRYTEEFDQYKAANPKADDEQAALAVLRKHLDIPAGSDELEAQIASVAAIIDETWRNLRNEVSQAQVKDKVLRYEALGRVLRSDTSGSNLMAALSQRVAAGENILAAAQDIISKEDQRLDAYQGGSTFRLAQKRDSLIDQDIPYMKRRSIPTWIILTTQAPGMSDSFAGKWVDEEMSLINLTTGFSYNGQTLEEQAQKLAVASEDRILTIAKKLISEFQLDHRVKEMIAKGEVKDEKSAIRRLIYDYSDFAKEVAKIYMLYAASLVPEGQTQHDYSKEPEKVTQYLKDHQAQLSFKALKQVIQENAELRANLTLINGLAQVDTQAANAEEQMNAFFALFRSTVNANIYEQEIEKYTLTYARDAVIEEIKPFDEGLYNLIVGATTPFSDKSLPPILMETLIGQKGMTAARQEIIGRYWLMPDGSIIPMDQVKDTKVGMPLMLAQNDPVYGYAPRGNNKKYNFGYGPSRVDLGAEERRSTEKWAQWIGPADEFAKEAMKKFYGSYNMDVRAFDEMGEAQTMKPLENTFLAATLAITQLCIGLFQAVGVGNLSRLIYETNSRPEVKIRAGGLGSAGFCIPKDPYFLIFVSTTVRNEILKYAGISVKDWPLVSEVKRALLKDLGIGDNPTGELAIVRDLIVAELQRSQASVDDKVNRLKGEFGRYSPALAGVALPPVANIKSLNQIGIGDPESNPRRFLDTLVAGYNGKVVTQLESRMRFAPVNALYLLRMGFADAKKARGGEAITPWEKAVVPLPVEYKPVSDPRLSAGLRMLEYLAGTGNPHLTNTFGSEGEQLADFLLFGFDRNNEAMRKFLEGKIIESQPELSNKPQEIDNVLNQLATIYPPIKGVGDVRMYSPFNLASEPILNYVSGTRLKQIAQEVRTELRRYLDDNQIEANVLTFGPAIDQWNGLSKSQKQELQEKIGQRIHIFVLQARLNNTHYRNTQGSDLWQAHKGSDVFDTIVHFPEVTGSEDEGRSIGGFGQNPRMIDDLARVRDTMRDGHGNSALIWLDAPVQGRKNVADLIAIKEWLALGGWYVCPMVSPDDVNKRKNEMNEERDLSQQLVQALLNDQDAEAEAVYGKIQQLARKNRFQQASEMFDQIKLQTEGDRGAGFNNLSARHQYYVEAWAKLNRGLPLAQLDLGTLTAAGLMYVLNGKTQEEITGTVLKLEAKLDAYHHRHSDIQPPSNIYSFSDEEAAEIMYLFVKPKYEETAAEQVLSKGESSSLKQGEEVASSAAGQAYANYMARQKANALAERVGGYNEAKANTLGQDFDALDRMAQKALGQADGVVTNKAFGAFLAYTETAIELLIQESGLTGAEKRSMSANLKALVDGGNNVDLDKWAAFMGKGDSLGSIGRLALAAQGDKETLAKLARAGGKLDIICALLLTQEYNQMTDAQVNNLGLDFVSNKVSQQAGEFFARTIYDHTFDYFPSWMHPAKAGNGFTDYDTIMGENLGKGRPLTRLEVLQLAAENHQWLDKYFDNLFKTKTQLRNKANEAGFAESILGETKPDGQITAPIGVDSKEFSPEEKAWWTYTQKREYAFLLQQGHQITGVFNDLDAAAILDGHHRTNIAVTSPIGRPHLIVFLAEAADYNRLHPDKQVNLVLTRSYDFVDVKTDKGTQRVMTIGNGLMYLDKETYIKARSAQLRQRGVSEPQAVFFATQEAEQALSRNPKGILVAARFKEALINDMSVPFHGVPYYQQGQDEAAGLPTTQSWLHNLFPGYAKTFEHEIYKGTEGQFLYPPEYQWYQKFQYDADGQRLSEEVVVDRILNGYQGFPGLRNIKWLRGISKPSKQSGGRGAIPMQLRNADGSINEEQLKEFARQLAQEGYKDDQVLQKFMSSSPYLWASPELIAKIRAGLIQKGIALPQGAPLFVYSRIIVNYQDNDPQKPIYSLELIVSSRMAVSNVGLGGVLFKWQRSFTDAKTAKMIMDDRRAVTALGMKLIEKTSEDFLKRITLTEDEYVQQRPGDPDAARAEYQDFHRSFPELVAMKPRLEKGPHDAKGIPADATGWSYAKPRYIMHDMLDTPIVQMPDGGKITAPDVLDVRLKDDGSLDYFVILDTRGEVWKEVKVTRDMIVGWRAVVIEHNIGYGLWNPFVSDERKAELALAQKQGRQVDTTNWGGELRDMLEAWQGAASAYKNSIGHPVEAVPTQSAPVYAQSAPVTSSGSSDRRGPLSDAVARVEMRLGVNKTMLGTAQLNLVFEEFALAHLIQQNGPLVDQRRIFLNNPDGSTIKISQQTIDYLISNKADLIRELPALLSHVSPEAISLLLSNKEFLGYVASGVVNRIFMESMAPLLQISNRLWTNEEVQETAGGSFDHVLVFDSLIGFADEMDHLVSAAALSEGKNLRTNVMAVLTKWIDPYTGECSKIIFYDRRENTFRLVALEQPLMPDRVQVMRLGRDEMKTHQKLSALYSKKGIPQVNANIVDAQGDPISAAAIADNKWATTDRLTDLVEVPEAMLIKTGQTSFDYLQPLRNFLLGLLERKKLDKLTIRLQPNTGTEGQNQQIFDITRDSVLKLNKYDPLIKAIEQMDSLIHQDIMIREEVGNIRLSGQNAAAFNRRVTFRANVTFAYPGKYSFDSGYAQAGAEGSPVSSAGQGGQIMSIQEALASAAVMRDGKSEQLILNDEDLEQFRSSAIRALEGINLGLSPEQQLYSAGIDIEIGVDADGKKHYWILDVNPRPTGLRHAQTGGALIPSYDNLWSPTVKETDIPNVMMQIIENDYDESHVELIKMIKDREVFIALADKIKEYLSRQVTATGDPKLLLKQERAIIIFGDLVWALKQNKQDDIKDSITQGAAEILSANGDTQKKLQEAFDSTLQGDSQEDYLKFVNPFLSAANQRELKDFQIAITGLTKDIKKPEPGSLRFQEGTGINTVHVSQGPMRFGISSANASDAWTAVKLRGGVVLNAAIDLDGQIPIQVQVGKTIPGQVELEIIGGLEGDPKRLVLDQDNINQFYTYQDPADPYRMLKYALIFTGIVQENSATPQEVLNDIMRFTNGQGLKIRITSYGPSRSGFASSSAVSINLLHALYEASGQKEYVDNKTLLGSMALLFENQLNLKSGRQDVDGPIFPLIKSIQYRKTEGFVAPTQEDVRILNMSTAQIADFQEHFMMVDTRIPRVAATDTRRGLNMRYLSYLSRRVSQGFDAIQKSFGIHQKIVNAFETANWPALGQAFLQYMSYREKIDPGATWSKFDKGAGEKVLRRMFDPLVNQGLIYGGMFTGAMGGGVAMLVLTDKGREIVTERDGKKIRRIDIALELLKEYESAQGVRPFENLRPIKFALDENGTQHQIREDMPSFEAAVEEYRRNNADNALTTVLPQPAAVAEKRTDVGGIDFDSALLSLQIKRDDKGSPLPIAQQPISNMKIDGFLPVIIKDAPANMPILLGAHSSLTDASIPNNKSEQYSAV